MTPGNAGFFSGETPFAAVSQAMREATKQFGARGIDTSSFEPQFEQLREKAGQRLHATHPVRLRMALDETSFLHDVGKRDKAAQVAKGVC
jgi:hypothetical protein